jgi:exonuclease III
MIMNNIEKSILNDNRSEEAWAPVGDMRLRRGLVTLTNDAQPPPLVSTRTYEELCCRATRELIRLGATEEEIQVEYERFLHARGMRDQRSRQRVRSTINSVGGSERISQFFRRECQTTLSSSPSPAPAVCLGQAWEVESNKVIGWFTNRRYQVQTNCSIASLRTEFRSCGVDDTRWIAVRWRDSHGSSSGMRRLEILCASRQEARTTRDVLNEKAGTPLAMTFTIGREAQVRERDRYFSERDHIRQRQQQAARSSSMASPLPAQRSRSMTPVTEVRDELMGNYFAPLSDLVEDVEAVSSPSSSVDESAQQNAATEQGQDEQRMLEVMSWNACGFRRKVNEYLKSIIQKVDIFGVCESLCSNVNLTRLDGFHHHGISVERKVLGGATASRGVSMYWRTDLQIRVTPIQHNPQDPDVIWIHLQPRQTTSIYVGCFYAPQHNDPNAELAFERLEQQVTTFLERGEVILMGDFNARTGLTNRNHDPVRNTSGPRLCSFVDRRNLEFVDLPMGLPPYTRVQGDSRSVIDYIIVSRGLAQSDKTKRVAMDDPMGSDHNPVRATIGIPARRSRPSARVQHRPAYEVLRDGPKVEGRSTTRQDGIRIRNQFAQRVAEALAPWKARWDIVAGAGEIPSIEQLDTAATEFTDTLKQVSGEVLGMVKTRKSKAHSWWNPTLTQKCRQRRRAYERLVAAGPSTAEQLWLEYIRTRREVKKCIEDARNKGWVCLMEKIVEAKKFPSQKRMWDLIRIVSKRAPMGADPLFIRGDNGDLTTDAQQAVNEWRAHFERVANPNANPNQFDAENYDLISTLEEIDSQEGPEDPSLELTVKDIMETLSTIPAGSAPGPDEIGNIVLKYGGGHRRTPFEPRGRPGEAERAVQRKERFASFLHTMFRLCLRARRVPTSWKNALQVPIPKRSAEEDPALRGNFRGITMQSATGKLYCRALRDKYLSEIYERTMCNEQGGFRKNRRCAHQHFLLADTIHRTISQEKGLFVVFVDIQKAYPSVWRDGLFYKLRRAVPHINSNLLAILKDCITGGETRIVLQGLQSEPYTSSVGLREGAVESPTLFNYYVNDLMSALNNAGCMGATISENWLGALFADDIVLVSDGQEDMQKCLDVLYDFCRKWRLTISMSKTKLMRVGTTEYDAVDHPLHIGTVEVEQVSKYQYLGLWFTEDGKWDVEYQERMLKVRDVESRIRHFFADPNVPIRARWIAWCALIRSRLEYGCEVFIASDDQMKELEEMQLSAARTILGCNRHTSLDAVYGDLKCQPLRVRFAKYRIRLYHELVTGAQLLPLHHRVWSINAPRRMPPHSFRREIKRVCSKYFNQPPTQAREFRQPAKGWVWAKKKISAKWVQEWERSMQEKIDKAEAHGSEAQMKLYQHLKGWWGDVPYTNLPDVRFTRVLFKIRSGTLPVFAFEGKRAVPHPTCVCCRQGVAETIQHFLWDCDGEIACSPVGYLRGRMLRGIRAIISSSRRICQRYGVGMATDESTVRRVALGTPLEMIFPDAFEWEGGGDAVLPLEMARTLTPESRGEVNRLQGRIMLKAKEFIVTWWQWRCAWVDSVVQAAHSPTLTPVMSRGAQVGRGEGRGRGRGRGRGSGQIAITNFFGSSQSEYTQGSNFNQATQSGGRGHVNDTPD